MNTAENNLDGLELLRALREGVDYSFIIKVRNFRLRVRPLSNAEYLNILTDVKDAMERAPEKLQTRVHEEIEIAKRTIIAASTSDVGANDPKISDYVLSKMTVGEILAIYKDYQQWETEVNPDSDTITVEKVKEMVDLLKKSPLEWKVLSRMECKAIVNYLITKEESREETLSTG